MSTPWGVELDQGKLASVNMLEYKFVAKDYTSKKSWDVNSLALPSGLQTAKATKMKKNR
jgi:hypothetical protein